MEEQDRKIRDRFAGLALTMMASQVENGLLFGDYHRLARDSYLIANAMMEERRRIEIEEEKTEREDREAKIRARNETEYASRVLKAIFDKFSVDEPTHAKDGTKSKYFIKDENEVILVSVFWNGFEWDFIRFERQQSLDGRKVASEASVPGPSERVRMYYEAAGKTRDENRKAELERRKKEFEARKSRKMAEAQAVRKPEELNGD